MYSARVSGSRFATASFGQQDDRWPSIGATTMQGLLHLAKTFLGLRSTKRLKESRMRYYAAREWIAMLSHPTPLGPR